MKSLFPHSVLWFCLLLLVGSSLAVGQENDHNAQEAAAIVAGRALMHDSATTFLAGNPEVNAAAGCCGDINCCSNAERCAACPECKNCGNGSCQVPRGVIACSRCNTAVRVNNDADAARVATWVGERCPFCSGKGLANQRTDDDSPAAAQPEGDCDCPQCEALFGPLAARQPIPGQVPFLRENDSQLAGQRDRLANELAEYLTSQPRDPVHVRDVLRMSLETAAAEAHAAAMDPNGNLQVTKPVQPDLAELEYELAETRNMILQTQRDLQMMNTSLQFLARHLKEQTAPSMPETNSASPGIAWNSQPTKMPPAVANELDNVRHLQAQVRDLQIQLQQAESSATARSPVAERTEQRLATAWPTTNMLEPTHWVQEPLRPQSRAASPLKPIGETGNAKLVWRHYYVGDLISPPVATTTFRLMQHIKAEIEPDSWRPEAIQIASPSVSLLVLQTPENHQRLERLLTDMGATMLR